ncbi:MAG: DUF3500 domain-containing protein [Candidatus Hydrogenedentales bacterium]
MERQRWARWLSALAMAFAATAATADDPALLGAVQKLSENLSAEEREQLFMPFNSDERLNWHFVPKGRPGLNLKEVDKEKQDAILEVVRAGLSDAGYEKVETIRSLEGVLREMEGATMRDPELYSLQVYGEPGAEGAWMIRYEGHHLSLNWTVMDGELVATSPQFLGANPAEVRIEHALKGTRALGVEEDLGRRLLLALDDDQRAQAVVAEEAPRDILTSNQREVSMLADEGVAYAGMTEEQQGLLLTMLELYASVQPPDIARARLDAIREAGLDAVKFAWMGGTEEEGVGHYYRIQGPTFLIEYDNTQNDANHVHTVWRDFKGDFGRDLLNEHYAQHADPNAPGAHEH